MTEIYEQAIRLLNFPFSLLLGLVVIYWVFAIIGVLDLDVLNFSTDADISGGHLDVDGGDGDVHLDHGGHGALHHIFGYLHVGEAPVTVILSLLTTFMWAISMTSNYYFNQGDSLLLGLCFLIPNFLGSITATGIAVIPVAALFRKLNDEENVRKDVLGEIGTVLTSKVDHESGQIEIATGAAPITVNARTSTKDEILVKGKKAVVVRKTDEGTYIIKSLEE
jgi:hypothetical protein